MLGMVMGLRGLRAKFLQDTFTQKIGILLAGLGKFDDASCIISLARSPRSERRRAAQTISNATPMTRLVSGWNDIPFR